MRKPFVKANVHGIFGDKELVAAFNRAAVTPLEQIAQKVQRSAKNSMRKGTKKDPAKPGKPPHRITGRLASSIKWAKLSQNKFRLQPNTIIVGPTGDGWYGKIHEWGVKGSNKGAAKIAMKLQGNLTKRGRARLMKELDAVAGWRVPPRPFMRPALKNTKRTMARKFEKLPLLQTPEGAKLDAQMRAIAKRGSKQWHDINKQGMVLQEV